MPYTASNRRNRSLMILPGWGQKVLLLAIIQVPHVQHSLHLHVLQMRLESYTQRRYSPWLVIKQSLVFRVDNTRVCRVLRICFHFHIVLQAQLQPASLQRGLTSLHLKTSKSKTILLFMEFYFKKYIHHIVWITLLWIKHHRSSW